MVAGRPIPVRVGDIRRLVETVPPVGAELTSARAQKAVERAGEACATALKALGEVAKSGAGMVERATARAAKPGRVTIEFGLRFSASAGVIMAGIAGVATVRVRLAYDAALAPQGPQGAGTG